MALRVAYLGPPGTFSHEALETVPGSAGFELLETGSIHAAVMAVQDGGADRALVPLENSLEGSVRVTLDALAVDAPDVEIVGEVRHPVHHCLVAPGRVALTAVTVVRSHPQGLAQCAEFLRRELPAARVVTVASTAEAVREVAHTGEGAAIGSRAAADRYGAVVLREAVEDVAGNETRFAWLAPAGQAATELHGSERDPAPRVFRTALVWWGEGSTSPGWLVRCLSEFAFRGVNLTRIESRPLRRPGSREYMFFVDADGPAGDAPLAAAIEGLGVHAKVVRVLGSYPTAG